MMSLRIRLFLAVPLTIVALAACGALIGKTGFEVPVLKSRLPAVSAASPWQGSQPGYRHGRWIETARNKRESQSAIMVPIQLKNPANLGVSRLLVASRGLAARISLRRWSCWFTTTNKA
jgi:hypothetical protein